MRTRLIVAAMVLSVVWPLAARGQEANNLAAIHKKVAGALAIVRYTYADSTGSRVLRGLGICIRNTDDAGKKYGMFMTLALDTRLPQENLKDFELVVPGVGGKVVKAKLLGVDPETGIGFVQAKDERAWSVVAFSAQSNVKIGQEVISVGALTANLGHVICLGSGRVSSVVRVPGKLVYVSAGKLTGVGSPVFDSTGRAIGMVGRQQLFLSFQTVAKRGVVPLPLKGVQETSFFVPVEEFVGALGRIPLEGAKPRRLPWMGVLKFDGVGKPYAEMVKLDVPGVMIGQVVPGSPAATANLKERDIIIEMNGQPLEELATPDLTARNLVRKMLRLKIGAKVTLTVFREEKKIPATVTLEAMPLRPSEAKRHFSVPLGLGLREKVAMDFHLDRTPTATVKGMVVIQLQRNGPAHNVRVKVGDLVTGIDEHFVTTCEDVEKIVKLAMAEKTRTTVTLLIRRGDKALPFVLQLRRPTAP